jgi:hypothetical protein
VLEFVPGATRAQRAKQGPVEIRRVRPRAQPNLVEIFVATRLGRSSRGLSVDLTQGTRRLGSFSLVASCFTDHVYGVAVVSCDFRGRHPWLLERV